MATRQRVVTQAARELADRIVRFVNLAWSRRLRTSHGLVDAVQDALDAGYSPDQIRGVYWSAACSDGFIRTVLTPGDAGSPELCLRHKGGHNVESGRPAKRWLDLLWEGVGEMRPTLIRELLADLESGVRVGGKDKMTSAEIAAEETLLERIEAPVWKE